MDSDGVVWIGTDNLGVSRLVITQNEGAEYIMEGENIRTLSQIGNGKFAVANKCGDMWVYDSCLQTVLLHESSEHNVYCVAEIGNGHLWKGTKGGGLYIDSKHVDEVRQNEIYSIFAESDTCVWIGTFGDGLLMYDSVEGRVRHHLLQDSYGSKRVRCMASDGNRCLWVATSDGVYAFDRCRSQMKPPVLVTRLSMANGMLLSDEVRSMFIDSSGRVYVSEAGEGFAVWEDGRIEHYTCVDSLVNDMVQCFVEDKEGFVWMSTAFGISRFNPVTKKIKNYFFSKNMLNNVFNENCGALLADGRIAFGSSNGIVVITPSVYDADEKMKGVDADEVCVNRQPLRRSIRYVVASWWESPWAKGLIAAFVFIGVCAYFMVRRRNQRFSHTISALSKKKDELTAEKTVLVKQKHELAEEKQALADEKNMLAEQNNKLVGDIHLQRDASQSASDRAFMECLEQIADRHISDSEFNVEDLAAGMGMGRTVFFKKMKGVTGYTPGEYIKQRRLHRAAYLISTTTFTISEIAAMVGINDALYLSRIFKAEYKCTPTEWRKHGGNM